MNHVTRILSLKGAKACSSTSNPTVPTKSITNTITSNIKGVKREKREERKAYIYNNREISRDIGTEEMKISFKSVPAYCWRKVRNDYTGCNENTCKYYDKSQCQER